MRAKISNNLLCCLCLASLVIVCNLFPTLGYCEPFFSIFGGSLFFFFFLDPARCWLNSCLQPWCWNITENYFIILKLVNKERQRTSLNHRAQCCVRNCWLSPTQMQPFTARLSPAAQVKGSLMRPLSEHILNSRSAPESSSLVEILFFLFFPIIN